MPALLESYALEVQRRNPMIDIHIRISRRLVLTLVVLFVVLPIVWTMLQTLGGTSSGGGRLDPVQNTGKR